MALRQRARAEMARGRMLQAEHKPPPWPPDEIDSDYAQVRVWWMQGAGAKLYDYTASEPQRRRRRAPDCAGGGLRGEGWEGDDGVRKKNE